MLALRVSRDKRGYDLIYLIWDQRRRGRPEPRLLYCCRLPAPLRVGPPPFDEEVRKRLEEAYPEIPFDWATLLKSLLGAVSSTPRPAEPPHAGYRDRAARRNGGPQVTITTNGSNGHNHRHDRGTERGGERGGSERQERGGERLSSRFAPPSSSGLGVHNERHGRSTHGWTTNAGFTHDGSGPTNGRNSTPPERPGVPAGAHARADHGHHRSEPAVEPHAFEADLHPDLYAEHHSELHPALHPDLHHDDVPHDELSDVPQAEPVWPGLSEHLVVDAAHEEMVVHLELPVPLASEEALTVVVQDDELSIAEHLPAEASEAYSHVNPEDAADADEAGGDEDDAPEGERVLASGQAGEASVQAASPDRVRRRRRRRRGGRSRGPGPVAE